MFNLVCLGLGSNQGDSIIHIKNCHILIEANLGKVVKASSLYKTQAWGKTDQPHFINQVVLVETLLIPQELLQQIVLIEGELGRKRKEVWGPRIIDIDILYFNDLVYQDAHITIPHAEIANRKFVLIPMVEIMPDYLHPVLHQTNVALLKLCSDRLSVTQL